MYTMSKKKNNKKRKKWFRRDLKFSLNRVPTTSIYIETMKKMHPVHIRWLWALSCYFHLLRTTIVSVIYFLMLIASGTKNLKWWINLSHTHAHTHKISLELTETAVVIWLRLQSTPWWTPSLTILGHFIVYKSA